MFQNFKSVMGELTMVKNFVFFNDCGCILRDNEIKENAKIVHIISCENERSMAYSKCSCASQDIYRDDHLDRCEILYQNQTKQVLDPKHNIDFLSKDICDAKKDCKEDREHDC